MKWIDSAQDRIQFRNLWTW